MIMVSGPSSSIYWKGNPDPMDECELGESCFGKAYRSVSVKDGGDSAMKEVSLSHTLIYPTKKPESQGFVNHGLGKKIPLHCHRQYHILKTVGESAAFPELCFSDIL
jgi:hypothetical protein